MNIVEKKKRTVENSKGKTSLQYFTKFDFQLK